MAVARFHPSDNIVNMLKQTYLCQRRDIDILLTVENNRIWIRDNVCFHVVVNYLLKTSTLCPCGIHRCLQQGWLSK